MPLLVFRQPSHSSATSIDRSSPDPWSDHFPILTPTHFFPPLFSIKKSSLGSTSSSKFLSALSSSTPSTGLPTTFFLLNLVFLPCSVGPVGYLLVWRDSASVMLIITSLLSTFSPSIITTATCPASRLLASCIIQNWPTLPLASMFRLTISQCTAGWLTKLYSDTWLAGTNLLIYLWLLFRNLFRTYNCNHNQPCYLAILYHFYSSFSLWYFLPLKNQNVPFWSQVLEKSDRSDRTSKWKKNIHNVI